MRNQTESPLLRLPAELRNRIYEYAFCVDCIDYHSNNFRSRPDYNHNPVRKTSAASQSLSSLLKSLLVCRQYHTETKTLVFQLSPFRARPRDLVEAMQKMPEDVQNAITVLRVYENRDWTSTRVYNTSYFPHFPSLRRVEVHSWAPRVVGDALMFAHEWNRRHVPKEDEVLRLRVEKWFRDLNSKETEDALMSVRTWASGLVPEEVEVTSIDTMVPSYEHTMENRWEVL